METDIFSIIETAKRLLGQLGLAEATIRTYQERSFNQIIRRYQENEDWQFCPDIMDELMLKAEEQYEQGILSRQARNWRIRGIRILTEIYETGSFRWKIYNSQTTVEFPDVFVQEGEGFLSSMSVSQKRLRNARSLTIRFCVFVSNSGINRLEDITSDILRAFLAEMHITRPASMDEVVSLLKKFFQYLEKNGTIIERHWQLLSSPRSRNHKVKPAMKHEELALILNQIDRKDICGKRDYAILILAVTTGLRAGDIVSMELSNISWKEQEIHLAQGKTGKRLVIPLQPSARDALADYILNGRPQTESRRIFLRNTVPYAPLQDGVSISCIFRKYLKLAGITHLCNDGKTFHGIRRAVGTYMVSGGVPVTTVSQVLGHQSVRATRQYISLDLQGLRKCALPMSSIGGAHGLS